jgi:purine-binding chemotaxis protein CheW
MSDDVRTDSGQYLTFVLDEEMFALDIFTVREVLEYTQITRVPRTAPFLRGIINVRGNAVPVIDLNMKFGKPQTKPTVDTSIIIAEAEVEGEPLTIGALADAVEEVVDLPEGGIDQAPSMGATIDSSYIKGMAKLEGRFIILLDFQKLFSSEELHSLRSAGGDEAAAA